VCDRTTLHSDVSRPLVFDTNSVLWVADTYMHNNSQQSCSNAMHNRFDQSTYNRCDELIHKLWHNTKPVACTGWSVSSRMDLPNNGMSVVSATMAMHSWHEWYLAYMSSCGNITSQTHDCVCALAVMMLDKSCTMALVVAATPSDDKSCQQAPTQAERIDGGWHIPTGRACGCISRAACRYEYSMCCTLAALHSNIDQR
jgi:hypothetical protein